MEKIINTLKKSTSVSAWKVTSTQKKSCELFYVLDKLETNRATDVIEYLVTVYVDEDGKRGSSSFCAYSYMDEEELNTLIEENVFAAKFAMNEFYELPKPVETKLEESKSNLKGKAFKDIIEEVVNAVFAANTYKDGYLSATEFFLYENTKRVVNSNGIDVSSVSYEGQVELIPSWEKDGEEVEVYHMLRFESFDAAAVTKEVDEELQAAKARFEAIVPPVKENIKVIIQNEEVGEILHSFVDELSYGSKYLKTNLYEIGENIQGDNVAGDKFNIKLVPYYKNAYDSKAFDNDGIVMKELEVIKDGVATNMYGSNQYGYYLGIKNPSGLLPVMVVKEGTKSFKEMASEPYIRCVKFSGIQVDLNSGYFGGEVRLGYYFDGTKEIPVTGFAISGDLDKSKSEFIFSKETVTTGSYHGPKYLEVKNITIG